MTRSGRLSVKQFSRGSVLQLGAGGRDLGDHQPANGIHVENLFAVASPPRLGPAGTSRDLIFSGPDRERLDIDVELSSGFIGDVGHPPAVRRKDDGVNLVAVEGV